MLVFRYGIMGAGKTTTLLNDARDEDVLFVPQTVGSLEIKSRDGRSTRAEVVYTGEPAFFSSWMFENEISSPFRIIVDEAQFLTPPQVRDLATVAQRFNIHTILYGLRTDFVGRPFPGSAAIMALADHMEEIVNLDIVCGRCKSSSMNPVINARFIEGVIQLEDSEQVCIGGDEKYTPICMECFRKLRLNRIMGHIY
jgi:thymidine kinase